MPYYSEDQLSLPGLIEWRNKKFKEFIYEDPKAKNSFMVTESLIPPISVETTLEGKYTRIIKGLWKTNNLAMGGPFVGLSFVDESLDRIYYIEGFLFSPGKSQRELVRELETILKTFRTRSELEETGS